MHPSSPFREEDVQLCVDALRVERDNLARAVATTLAEAKVVRRRRWSWWHFVVGFCVLPVAGLLLIALETRMR